MTSQNLARSKPRGKLECNANEVIAMLLDGSTEREVAAHFGASRRGVELFKKKHTAEIADVKAAAVEKVKTDWIADRAARIAKLQGLYELAEAEVTEYGITIVEKRTESDDGKETVYEMRDFRGQMVKEMRGILRDAATELGQIVPPPRDGISIDKAIINIMRGSPELGV